MKRIVIALLLSSACAGLTHDTETLPEAVRSYNDGVRWGRYGVAANKVPARERADFIADMDERAETVKITDYDVVDVAARSDHEAKVRVKIGWYSTDQGTVHETHAIQTWDGNDFSVGPDLFGVSAKDGTSNVVHDVTIEGCHFIGQTGSQQTVAISTKTPTHGWVIRGNVIDGAGTGLYLGNILYALEATAHGFDQEGKAEHAGFYRGIARLLAEARGREKRAPETPPAGG